MERRHTVVIVDDEKHVAHRLSLGFDWDSVGFKVIGTFTDSIFASMQIPLLNPDVVVSDIRMPGFSGLELMKKVRQSCEDIRFLFISGHEEFSFVHQALQLGASGYCLKPIDEDELSTTMRKIRDEIEEDEVNLSIIFESALRTRQEPENEILLSRLQKISFISSGCYILASFNDISDELLCMVRFKTIQYDRNVYFYFVERSPFVESDGFLNRMRQKLIDGSIKNFCYIQVMLDGKISEDVTALLEELYKFFITRDEVQRRYFILHRKNRKGCSNYFRKLEMLFGNHDVDSLLVELRGYETDYPESERNIYEIIDIYNLVMTLLFQVENTYFKDRMYRPSELVASFSDFSQLMRYLSEQVANMITATAGLDFNQISNDNFKEVLSYINENYTHSLTFQSLSLRFEISPSYLCQIFQKEINMTFTRYLTQLRISRAKKLLLETNSSITEIGAQSGFDQYFYFARVFKKEVGISPTQYREINKTKETSLKAFGIPDKM